MHTKHYNDFSFGATIPQENLEHVLSRFPGLINSINPAIYEIIPALALRGADRPLRFPPVTEVIDAISLTVLHVYEVE